MSSYSGSSLDRRAFSAMSSSIRVGRLRIVIAPAQPGAARESVEVPPVLLDVLAVIALAVGEPEHPLLEDRIAPVPQGQPEAQPPEDVGQPGHPVLVPAIRAGPRVVMREVRPCVAVRAVVLAHRAPGALAEVRTPQVPRACRVETLLEMAGIGHSRSFDAEGCPTGCRHEVASSARPPAARTMTERGPAR